jgi:hypothetical protein
VRESLKVSYIWRKILDAIHADINKTQSTKFAQASGELLYSALSHLKVLEIDHFVPRVNSVGDVILPNS